MYSGGSSLSDLKNEQYIQKMTANNGILKQV